MCARLSGGLHWLSGVLLRALQRLKRNLHSSIRRLHQYENPIFVYIKEVAFWMWIVSPESENELCLLFTTVIPNYCTAAPNATVSNSVIVGTYVTALGNTSNVGCAIGYAASGSSSIATCTPYNVSNGIWSGLSLTCTRTLIFIKGDYSRISGYWK